MSVFPEDFGGHMDPSLRFGISEKPSALFAKLIPCLVCGAS